MRHLPRLMCDELMTHSRVQVWHLPRLMTQTRTQSRVQDVAPNGLMSHSRVQGGANINQGTAPVCSYIFMRYRVQCLSPAGGMLFGVSGLLLLLLLQGSALMY